MSLSKNVSFPKNGLIWHLFISGRNLDFANTFQCIRAKKRKKAIHKKTITEMQSSIDSSIQTHLKERSGEEGLQV